MPSSRLKIHALRLLTVAACLSFGITVVEAKSSKRPKPKPTPQQEIGTEPPIRAGAEITVTKVNSNRTLEVQINSEPDVGPNIATPEALVKAIAIDDPSDRKSYLENLKKFKGVVFTLKNDLSLLVPDDGPPAGK